MYLFTVHLCIHLQPIYVSIHSPFKYLLTANFCIYSQPIYWIFRSPWQLMPSFSTESLNQWGPLASCRYFINVLTRDEWGRVFVTGAQICRAGHILLISANWNHMPHQRKPWFASIASIAGPFGHFALTFLGLFKTMTMTFFRTMTWASEVLPLPP